MPEIDPRDERYVPPDGDKDAKIIVLGEAPGKNEHIKKIPFVGWSGDFLFKKLLLPAKILRKDCLVLNVCPIYPGPGDIRRNLKRLDIDIYNCVNDAKAIIEEYPRSIIIAVGDEAMRAMTGQRGITKWRGSWMEGYNGTSIIPMIHPAFLQKVSSNWIYLPMMQRDAYTAKFHLDNPKWNTPTRTAYTCHQIITSTLKTRSVIGAMHNPDWFLDRLKESETSSYISFDIETSSETITVFGFATSTTEAYSIPFTGVFSSYDEARLVEGIRSLLSTSVPKVSQNGIYDCTYLADKWGVAVRGHVWDTMLMHHCVYSEMRHSLAHLTSQYTPHPFYKDMAKDSNNVDYHNQHWEYNALDVATTLEVFFELKKELEHYRLTKFYLEFYVPLSRHLARIQRRGIPLDKEELFRLRIEIDKKLLKSRERIKELFGDVNIDSPKQMLDLLYSRMKLPIQRHRKTRKPTTDEGAINKLKTRTANPKHQEFFKLLLEVRGDQKLRSTYLKDDLEDPDGRVRCSYNIAGDSRKPNAKGGTGTGRLSSSANCYGRGTNLQNQPDITRSMFIAPPGWDFFSADLSAAESYIVAWCSGDERMLDILTKHRLYNDKYGDKVWLHEETGHILLGIPRKEVTGELRQMSKKVRHGWSYYMNAPTLMSTVNDEVPNLPIPFDLSMAKESIEKLNKAHPYVVQWWGDTRSTIISTRRLSNCFGRQRIFLGRMEDETFRSAFSTLPQGEVSDHLNRSMVAINRHCEEVYGDDKAQVLGQVHDSIMGIARKEIIDDVKQMTVAELESPLPRVRDGIACRIPCDFGIGPNWRECK